MDRGAWRATVYGVAKSQTCLATKPPQTEVGGRKAEPSGCVSGDFLCWTHGGVSSPPPNLPLCPRWVVARHLRNSKHHQVERQSQAEQEGPWVRGDQQRIHNKSGGDPNGEAPPPEPSTAPSHGAHLGEALVPGAYQGLHPLWPCPQSCLGYPTAQTTPTPGCQLHPRSGNLVAQPPSPLPRGQG